MTQVTYLDRAGGDPAFYAASADQYAKYLAEDYPAGLKDPKLRPKWMEHVEEMREALLASIFSVLERKSGRLADMNAAIAGPGMMPAELDIGKTILQQGYRKMNSLTAIDYSRGVIQSAVASLANGGMARERLFALLYDLTGGLSTVYQQWVIEKLRDGRENAPGKQFDEQALSKTLDEMRGVDMMEEIFDRWWEAMKAGGVLTTAQQHESTDQHRELDQSSILQDLHLAYQGSPIQVDHFYLPLVLDGTGIPTELQLWGAFNEATQSTDRQLGGRAPAASLIDTRRELMNKIHDILALFNTEISEMIVRRILRSHPGAIIIAPTGVSTNSELNPYSGVNLPRLHVNTLSSALREVGVITLEPTRQHYFRDSVSHGHDVRTFMFANSTANGNTTPPTTPA